MVDALSRSDGPELITLAREFAESAPDYEHVLGEILSLLRRIAVVQTLGDGAEVLDESDDVMRFAAEMSAEDCQLFYQIGLIGRRDLSLAPDPQSGFERVPQGAGTGSGIYRVHGRLEGLREPEVRRSTDSARPDPNQRHLSLA